MPQTNAHTTQVTLPLPHPSKHTGAAVDLLALATRSVPLVIFLRDL